MFCFLEFKLKASTCPNNDKFSKIEDFDIIVKKVYSDTLLLVTTSSFLYYPFGVYGSLEKFQNDQSIWKTFSNDVAMDSNTEKNYRSLKFRNSYLTIYFNEEKGKVDIVKSFIEDYEIKLMYCIKKGILKQDFIKILNANINDEFKEVNVIKLESGLTGIVHYYTFKGVKLENIRIESDYSFAQ